GGDAVPRGTLLPFDAARLCDFFDRDAGVLLRQVREPQGPDAGGPTLVAPPPRHAIAFDFPRRIATTYLWTSPAYTFGARSRRTRRPEISFSTRATSKTSSMRSVRVPTVRVCRASPSHRGGGLRR